MILDTIEAWQVDNGDFLVIEGQECTVVSVEDNGDYFAIVFKDEFGEEDLLTFDTDHTFEIWGN